MEHVSELVKFLKDPHSKKIQQYKERYLELDELSLVAIDIQDEAAYKSIQVEMREVFFDFLTASVVDSIYKLFPHAIIVCLLSLKFPTVNIPLINWQADILLAYIAMYLLFRVIKSVVKTIRTRLKKRDMCVLQ